MYPMICEMASSDRLLSSTWPLNCLGVHVLIGGLQASSRRRVVTSVGFGDTARCHKSKARRSASFWASAEPVPLLVIPGTPPG